MGGVTTNEGTLSNTVNFGNGSTTGNLITLDQYNGLSNLANVTVQLYRNGMLLATTTSDANGEYYFNNMNVPGGLLPFTAYKLQVPLSQTASSGPGYVLVQVGAGNGGGVDNDAVSINGIAVISVTTGSYGEAARLNNTAFPANITTAPVLYYVYAIMNPTPNADGCRPARPA